MSGPGLNPAGAGASRAVFLSYAREDAAAAQRISEALHSQGIEVWFDQSELRGGDAWDQKIRRQIKECALFVPIISHSTQARGEGYFRLEWKLAVERTHLMAEGVPFLAPIVVDETAEGSAIVPAEFMRVQWVRLPGALPTPQFVGQVKRMLESAGKQGSAPAFHAHPSPTQGAAAAKRPAWGVFAAVGIIAVAAGAFVLLRKPAPEPVVVAPAPAPSPAEPVVPSVDPKSIAILPFENMSEDKENAFFADGVHEDLLTNLSYVKDLHVVSRTSVMRYRSTTKSIKEIGQELGVAFVLEGSVRREGNKVRVTGQLINARTDEHVWAKAYDRDLTDIFAIQGELAQSIADALQAVLSPEAKALLARRPTENTVAYDDYVKARQTDKSGMGTLRPSIELLKEAVRLDPNFAAAWAELASRYAFVYFSIETTDEIARLAKETIDTAVRLAPDDPAVIEGQGDYYYYAYRDYTRATEQYLRLAEMKPNDPIVYESLGLIQRRQGRVADAIANFQKAHSLDGTFTDYIFPLMQCYFGVRRYPEAIALCERALKATPGSYELQNYLCWMSYEADGSTEAMTAFAQKKDVAAPDRPLYLYVLLSNAEIRGDWPETLRINKLQRYYDGNTDDPPWGQDAFIAEVLAESGDMEASRVRANEALVQLKAEVLRQPQNQLVWSNLSLCHALLGERDEAAKCAEKSLEIMPESRDALAAPANAIICSLAHCWMGDKDRAIAEIDRLLRTPFGLQYYTVKGVYRPLQDDPRFKALLSDPKVNAPLPGT